MDELKEKLEKELLQLERKMMGASQSVYARCINDAYYLADLYLDLLLFFVIYISQCG